MTSLGNKDVFAKNLKKYMQLNGKTRNEVCQALGLKYTTFADWVNGKKYPQISTKNQLHKNKKDSHLSAGALSVVVL